MPDVAVDFAVRDGAWIAYEVFGNGPIDLVVNSSVGFPIDLMWELPQLANFMDGLGRVARVIAYDRRGCGASDPLPTTDGAAGVESSAADMLAVLEAVGSEKPSLLDLSFGGTVVFFAVTYPQRVRSIILQNLRSSFPELRGLTPEQRKTTAAWMRTTSALRAHNPRVAHDPALQRWWGRAQRLASSPEETARAIEFAANLDVEPLLEHVRAPTLVLHRKGNRAWGIEESRAAAARIPHARFVELAGNENELFLGDTKPALSEITRFLREDDVPSIDDQRLLATVLFTDLVASTERLATIGDESWRRVLDEHDGTIEMTVRRFHGRVVKRMGDGTLATFDGPARAVRCAAAIRDALGKRGLIVRSGLHTGEIEMRDNDVTGLAVHISSRISGMAKQAGILVSRTVVDLTGGSGITYDALGEFELRGIPGMWPLFAANVPPAPAS
jgi:class 3 adenylate cyclase